MSDAESWNDEEMYAHEQAIEAERMANAAREQHVNEPMEHAPPQPPVPMLDNENASDIEVAAASNEALKAPHRRLRRGSSRQGSASDALADAGADLFGDEDEDDDDDNPLGAPSGNGKGKGKGRGKEKGKAAAPTPRGRGAVPGSPSGASQDGSWGGHDDAALGMSHSKARQYQDAENANRAMDVEDPDQNVDSASLNGGGSAGDDPLYQAFDAEIMKVDGMAQPLLLPRDELWKLVEDLGPHDMRPKRAMCFNVLTDFFRRDADYFRQWQRAKGADARCKATAAIVSLVFAGMAQGLPCGNHEEYKRSTTVQGPAQGGGDGGRAKDKAVKPLTSVTRYVYSPMHEEADAWPMVQIGIEEIYNEDQTDVLALRVWLFVYDETHSTSHLMRRVVESVQKQHASQRAGAQAPESRSRDMAAETQRHDKAGFGFGELDANFENNVGMQYKRVRNMEDWYTVLALHSGTTSAHPGCPCVKDLHNHVNCVSGRRAFEGDLKSGYGGKHPAAPEFVFNGKRRDGLRFGLAGLDGAPLPVNPEQLDTSMYWYGDGHFRVPNLDRSCFWMCTSSDRLTPFDMPLTRPLQGTVIPGNALMRLFLEMELREKNRKAGRPGAVISADALVIDQGAHNRLRSLATQRDEHQRAQDQLLRNTVRAYDLMSPAAQGALAQGGEIIYDANPTGEDGANYTIKTKAMTTSVSEESDRIYSLVVSPWVSMCETDLAEQAAALRKEKVSQSDPRWQDYYDERRAFNERFYHVKRDITQYHLRLLRTCFLSSKDCATLPAGYKAMYQGLEDGIAANGGSASIAFNGQGGKGFSMRQKDRQVWGALQEWLRVIFVDNCKIDGRDRRYTDVTFMLIIASEKGQGKSVRAERMSAILPGGWCSENSASSARSGMNGNNSPSNGTVVIADEMISDLTGAECTERVEYFKTLAGKREYVNERTRAVKNSDGSDALQTFKIVTDHKECYLICCNLGQTFTIGDQEPSSGKAAMIQRTVCLFARKEADDPSSTAAFKANLKLPQVAANIRDFRLLTELSGYVRLAMMGLDWLQPDLAVANLVFKAGDTMLQDEYGMPRPEPRRLVKRTEDLKTMCVHEAVARVYLFKQTACMYEAGAPDEFGNGKPFDPADLWDVLRTLVPTREMILAAWSGSLEYSIGTSSHGVNIMNAICEKLGFLVEYLFRRLPSESANSLTADDAMNTYELPAWLNEEKTAAGMGAGAKQSALDAEAKRLRETRMLRNEFRVKALDKPQSNVQPIQGIQNVMVGSNSRKFTDALFPTFVTASMYYKPTTLLQWAMGNEVPHDEARCGHSNALDFKERESSGGAKTYDFAWLKLYENKAGAFDRGSNVWAAAAREMQSVPACKMFDMHVAGIKDGAWMLSTSENTRLVAEQPSLPYSCSPEKAFVDDKGNSVAPAAIKNYVTHIKLRPTALSVPVEWFPAPDKDSAASGGASGASGAAAAPAAAPAAPPNNAANGKKKIDLEVHLASPIESEARTADGAHHRSKVNMHTQLDRIHQRCRLPALQPHTSTRIARMPPLRKSDTGNIEINSVVVYEHLSMIMEGILRCSKVPGLKGLQERFASGGKAPGGLTANDTMTEMAGRGGDAVVRRLPYSIDMMQMAWTIDLASRFYNPSRGAIIAEFNKIIALEKLGDALTDEDMPEVSLRYPGFPAANVPRGEALRLVSMAIEKESTAGTKPIDIASANPIQELDPELLRYETEVAIGREATDADIEEHRRSLIGEGYVWGVEGDVFSYETWVNHLYHSMIGRGNTCGSTDGSGVLKDKGFVSVLDSEHMLQARLVERRCNSQHEGFKHLNIRLPVGSTYRYTEKHPIRTARETGKRRAEAAPRAMYTGVQVLTAQFKAPRSTGSSGASSSRRPSQDGDSRDE